MKFLFYILIPILSFGQDKVSDACHVYGSALVCDISYHIQTDKKPVKRYLVSLGTGLTVGFTKEVFDSHRPNIDKRTGFSKSDLFLDAWGCLLWVPFRICLNDYKKNKRLDKTLYEFH